MRMDTKEWRQKNGGREIDLGVTPPRLVFVQAEISEDEKKQVDTRYMPGDDGVGYAYGGQYQGYTAVNPGLTPTPESMGR